jgi:hypothetical protein
VQRRGWFYHVYPLGVGLACWGAWSLASLPPWRAVVCLLATAITPVWLAQEEALIRARMYGVLHSASAMQAALEGRLPRGARVQMLDSDYGAFLAMARAGMHRLRPISNGSPLSLPRIPFGASSLPRSRMIRRPRSSSPTPNGRSRTASMPPIVGRSLRRCWHHVMSSTDPKMRTALLGGST